MITFDTVYKASIIGTFVVLVWYTIETYRIRRINTKQKDLQLLPALTIYIRQRSGSERPVIRNIGLGTALAIKIEDSSVTESSTYDFRFHLVDGNNTLEPREERQIGVNVKKDGQDARQPLPTFLHYYEPAALQEVQDFIDASIEGGEPLGTLADFPTERNLVIAFSDITGQRYKTTIHFSGEGISVAKAPKRIAKHNIVWWKRPIRLLR